jgi:hypothetical protein
MWLCAQHYAKNVDRMQWQCDAADMDDEQKTKHVLRSQGGVVVGDDEQKTKHVLDAPVRKLPTDKRGEVKTSATPDAAAILFVISTDEDFIVSAPNCCVHCLQTKLSCTVLADYALNATKLSLWKQDKLARLVRIKCECASRQKD